MGNFIDKYLPGFIDPKTKEFPRMNIAFTTDGLCATMGSVGGLSPICVSGESGAGIREGARTGIGAIFIGILFLISMFFAPLFGTCGCGMVGWGGVVHRVVQQVGAVLCSCVCARVCPCIITLSMYRHPRMVSAHAWLHHYHTHAFPPGKHTHPPPNNTHTASIPPYATGPALIVVGSLMMSTAAEIDWGSPMKSIPAFITIAMMPLTYSIAVRGEFFPFFF